MVKPITFIRKIYLCFGAIIIFSTVSISQTNNLVPKKGGICFRVDDNGLMYQFDDYTAIFNKYNQKFTFGLNLGLNEFDSQEYINKIISYQNMGHELMDHTPDHRTNYFYTKFDVNLYINDPGVDHTINNKICLVHENPDLQLYAHTGTASIKNNEIEFSDSDFGDLVQYDERYIYVLELDSLFLVTNYHNKKAKITDIWDEQIILSDQNGITYYTFIRHDINLIPSAIYLLANETKKLATLFGLTPPKTFIQPGGNFLDFHSYEISSTMESLGYTSGATYPNSAEKVYNEYNPDNERQFAMQWGDFIETDQDLEYLKSTIAEETAKNKMLIGNSHWYTGEPEDWNTFIIKNDSLLSWVTSNTIPIKTYFDWSDILYNQTPDPYYNIIPPLNVDKDQNGIPDGHTQFRWPGQSQGIFVVDNTTPGPGENYYSIETDQVWNNRITYIEGLGGFEKGENDFSIWTKGEPGDSIKVTFSEPWPSNISTSFKFAAETTDWQKQSLSKQGENFIVEESQSVLDVDIHCSDYVSGTVKIAGMALTKMVDIESLELNVISSLPSLAGDSIFVEVIAKDEFGIPHENYFDYNLEITGSSSVNILPSIYRSFSGNEKDTIIVIDTVAGNSTLKAKLTNDNLITDSSLINIKNREIKYLEVLSISDSITIGDSRLLQVVIKDTFMNKIPDSLITFELLNGNGKFGNDSQVISSLSDLNGIAKDLYTASTSISFSADSIKVHYNNSIIDTIVLSLKSAPISRFDMLPLVTLPALAGDSILIEISARDGFNNLVVNSSNYRMKANQSNSVEFIPTNIFNFNNNSQDTILVRDTTAGSFYLITELISDTTIVDSSLIEIIHNIPEHFNLLSSNDSISVGTSRDLKVKLEDKFNNTISDSLITFEALNGNGKFSNDLQIISILTDTIGIAQNLFTASTDLIYNSDSIKINFENTILDTIILPLLSGQINKFELTTLGTLPVNAGDSIFIEITAKDIFLNEVRSSEQFNLHANTSTTAMFLPTNIFNFNNSSKDTIIVVDSIAGSFYAIAQLESNSLVVDSAFVEVVYSTKVINLRLMLEGAYSASSEMRMDINSLLPLGQPYNVLPWLYTGTESVENIPNNIVDWVLVTLREDVDPNIPDPPTAIEIITKAAFLKNDGYVVELNGIDPINFIVRKGKYYIVIKQRNHLPIMSKTAIDLLK